MKATIFVAITIAALGAVGITTAIISSGIPVHAQVTNGQVGKSLPNTGHQVVNQGGTSSASGHAELNTGVSGGGHVIVTGSGTATQTVTKCVGSTGFKETVAAVVTKQPGGGLPGGQSASV